MNVTSIFHLKGRGSVLAGRLVSGRISTGEEVEIRSPTKCTRVLVIGVEVNKKVVRYAEAETDLSLMFRDFIPENIDDGLESDATGGYKVIHLKLNAVTRPWWKIW